MEASEKKIVRAGKGEKKASDPEGKKQPDPNTGQKKEYTISEAIAHVRSISKERKFVQSFDVIINLKNIDLRKPENKFSKEAVLPHGRGKGINVCVISDNIKDAVTKKDIQDFSKKDIRNLIKNNDFFISEAPLMPFIGKVLGKYLAPLGKMPSPFPPNIKDLTSIVNTKKKSVHIKIRDDPTMHVPVGTEKMPDNEIEKNIQTVLSSIEKALPKGRNQLKSIYLKLTMTKAVKIAI